MQQVVHKIRKVTGKVTVLGKVRAYVYGRQYCFKAPVLIGSNSTNICGGLQSSAADCGGLQSSSEIGRITPNENGSFEIIMSYG